MKCQYCKSPSIATERLETKRIEVCADCLDKIEMETNKTVVFKEVKVEQFRTLE